MIPKFTDLFDTTKNVIILRGNGFFSNVYVLERAVNGIPINILYLDKGEIKRQRYTEKPGEEPIPFLKIPTMTSENLLSEVIDALIDFGIKPKKSIIQLEEKSALERHLSDMRKIVSKKIGVEL